MSAEDEPKIIQEKQPGQQEKDETRTTAKSPEDVAKAADEEKRIHEEEQVKLEEVWEELGLKEKQAESSPEQMLEDIRNSKPTTKWEVYIPDKKYGTEISLPHDCFISASLNYLGNERVQLYIDMFSVNENIQKGGVGTRLLKALVADGKQYGATELYGHVTSESALKTRAKVFGADSLEFYNHETKKKLDISLENALKTSKDGIVSFDVRVDLSSIDTSEWELPENITKREK